MSAEIHHRLDFKTGKFELFMFSRDGMADDVAECAAEEDVGCPVVAGINHSPSNHTSPDIRRHTNPGAIKLIEH